MLDLRLSTTQAACVPTGQRNASLLAIAMLMPALGCGEPAADPPASPSPVADVATERAPVWRYLPTLRDATPKGVTAEPILEVATPDDARLHIVAAVHRPAATPELRIELWSFSQHNAKGTLASTDEPEVVLRVTADEAPPPALDELRRRLAAPGGQLQRPVGLDVDSPAALLDALAGHATTVRDATADPQLRVQALAALVRGLDDTVVIETRGLPRAIDALARGEWKPNGTREISSRRIAVSVGGDPPAELVVGKKSGGWAVIADRPYR